MLHPRSLANPLRGARTRLYSRAWPTILRDRRDEPPGFASRDIGQALRPNRPRSPTMHAPAQQENIGNAIRLRLLRLFLFPRR